MEFTRPILTVWAKTSGSKAAPTFSQSAEVWKSRWTRLYLRSFIGLSLEEKLDDPGSSVLLAVPDVSGLHRCLTILQWTLTGGIASVNEAGRAPRTTVLRLDLLLTRPVDNADNEFVTSEREGSG
jgi:hypothetical protein